MIAVHVSTVIVYEADNARGFAPRHARAMSPRQTARARATDHPGCWPSGCVAPPNLLASSMPASCRAERERTLKSLAVYSGKFAMAQ